MQNIRYIKIILILLLVSCAPEEDMIFIGGLSEGDVIDNSLIPNLRTATFNVYLTFGDTAKKTAIKNHVDRADADVVSFTETSVADFTYVQSTYTDYSYFAQSSGGGDWSLMMISKFPISYSETVSVDGFSPLYCEISVNGKTIGILTIHAYPDCIALPCRDEWTDLIIEPNGWNRTVQMYEYMKFLNDRKIAIPSIDSFIIQGDWNEDTNWNSPDSYSSQVSGGYSKPAYLSYPVDRTTFPDTMLDYYSGTYNIVNNLDLAGGRNTLWTFDPNSALTVASKIDYQAYTGNIQLVASEIINSEEDGPSGMEKVGSPLISTDSRDASDHLFLVSDFYVEEGTPTP